MSWREFASLACGQKVRRASHRHRSSVSAGVAALGLLLAIGSQQTVAADVEAAPPSSSHQSSHTARASLSGEVHSLLDWIGGSADNANTGFIVIDKKAAMLHVFDAQQIWRASSPVLLGSAEGDDSVPGIGDKAIAEVAEHERTTPAGRFVAERGRNAKGVDVVWIDYDAAVSMHRVINEVPAEQRLQRLATPTSSDNRISYGCINVPVAFYESQVRPMFATYRAIVYILPEHRPMAQVFGIDESRLARNAAAPP